MLSMYSGVKLPLVNKPNSKASSSLTCNTET